MKDPYKVLGISPNATDDEVKAAYKAYKPVSFVDNVQHRLLMSQHYKVYRLLNQLCAFAGKLIEWGKR